MVVVKYILLALLIGFVVWQSYGLVKEIIQRNKNKKEKAQKEAQAKAVATEDVDKKESI